MQPVSFDGIRFTSRPDDGNATETYRCDRNYDAPSARCNVGVCLTINMVPPYHNLRGHLPMFLLLMLLMLSIGI